MEEWTSLLSEELINAAYTAAASRELAWTKANALMVIKLLGANGYEISGIDTWMIKEKQVIPYCYDWDRDKNTKSPTDFVEMFSWDPKDTFPHTSEPFFNILPVPKTT